MEPEQQVRLHTGGAAFVAYHALPDAVAVVDLLTTYTPREAAAYMLEELAGAAGGLSSLKVGPISLDFTQDAGGYAARAASLRAQIKAERGSGAVRSGSVSVGVVSSF